MLSICRAILKAVPIAATTTRDHGMAASILRSTSVESGFVTECCTWRPTTATCRKPEGEGERRVTKKEGKEFYCILEKSSIEFKYRVDTSGR